MLTAFGRQPSDRVRGRVAGAGDRCGRGCRRNDREHRIQQGVTGVRSAQACGMVCRGQAAVDDASQFTASTTVRPVHRVRVQSSGAGASTGAGASAGCGASAGAARPSARWPRRRCHLLCVGGSGASSGTVAPGGARAYRKQEVLGASGRSSAELMPGGGGGANVGHLAAEAAAHRSTRAGRVAGGTWATTLRGVEAERPRPAHRHAPRPCKRPCNALGDRDLLFLGGYVRGRRELAATLRGGLLLGANGTPPCATGCRWLRSIAARLTARRPGPDHAGQYCFQPARRGRCASRSDHGAREGEDLRDFYGRTCKGLRCRPMGTGNSSRKRLRGSGCRVRAGERLGLRRSWRLCLPCCLRPGLARWTGWVPKPIRPVFLLLPNMEWRYRAQRRGGSAWSRPHGYARRLPFCWRRRFRAQQIL